jgi:hypothetical protein
VFQYIDLTHETQVNRRTFNNKPNIIMNDIYWQQKRSMTSKQFSSSPPDQSKCLYENKYQTKRYQQVDSPLNTYSAAGRIKNSSYFQYPTVLNRSYHNTSLPYASSVYGVYRRSPPNPKAPPTIYTDRNRRVDVRNKSRHSQQHQSSHSVSRDYYYSKHEELNGHIKEIYDDETENDDDDDDDDDEDNLSDIFDDTGVSLK